MEEQIGNKSYCASVTKSLISINEYAYTKFLNSITLFILYYCLVLNQSFYLINIQKIVFKSYTGEQV